MKFLSILIFIFSQLVVAQEEVPKEKKAFLVMGEYPPYASAYAKEKGISSYFVKKAFKKAGFSAEIDFLPWSLSLIEARKGKTFHGSVLWSKTPKREEEFLFSDVVLEQVIVFFHRKKDKFEWKKFKDLQEKTIGTTLGYSYGKKMDYLIEKGLIKTVPTAEIISNLRRLIKGTIDLFPVEPIIAKYYLKKIAETDPISANLLTYNRKPIHYYKLHLIANKEKESNKELIEKFNQGLKSLKDQYGKNLVKRPCITLYKGDEVKEGISEKEIELLKSLCP